VGKRLRPPGASNGLSSLSARGAPSRQFQWCARFRNIHKIMEEIIRRLRSSSTSLSPTMTMENNAATADLNGPDHPSTMKPKTATLEALPAEIVTHILTFLPSNALAALSQTSQLLRSHALNDLLWMQYVKDELPNSGNVTTPAPAQYWKELYIAHHPYWFLVRNKIWFSDNPNTGTLILTRYNQSRGCIEGYRLVAEHGAHTFDFWTHNPDVIIHTFNPKVRLWTDDPVIKLDLRSHTDGSRLQKEVSMQTGSQHGICSMISLCRPIPKELQDPSMALWPPSIIPSTERVRNESPNKFRTDVHRPQSIALMSEYSFRIRKWLEFSNLTQPLSSVRMGEDVMTFSTILEESYKPTKERPWQGIWVGDYSGHGCEFLLVLQREVTSNTRLTLLPSTGNLPEGMSIAEMEAETTEQGMPSFQPSSSEEIEFESDGNEAEPSAVPQIDNGAQVNFGDDGLAMVGAPPVSSNYIQIGPPESIMPPDSEDRTMRPDQFAAGHSLQEIPPLGRLEAIKLTGDINVPRGQYTWIAEDIGPKGLIRVADEQMFAGARMIKSWGRIAGRGFRHDRFIPSQLIMISHDTLAQYWEVCWPTSDYECLPADSSIRILDIFPSTRELTSTIFLMCKEIRHV